MGYPSLLESITERLFESFSNKFCEESSPAKQPNLTQNEIRKIVQTVIDQLIPSNIRDNLNSNYANQEYHYKSLFENEFQKFGQLEKRFSDLRSENTSLIQKCEALRKGNEELVARSQKIIEENKTQREEIISLKNQIVICHENSVRQLQAAEHQRLCDIQDWKNFT